MTTSRHYLFAIIALAVAVVLAFILLSLTRDPYAGGATSEFVVPERFRKQILELDKRGLDEAYIKHLELLFKTWVGDAATLSHDPTRINKGLAQTRQAYVIAIERIEARDEK
jgi:hypothetical protein